jgi:hypothetical protein
MTGAGLRHLTEIFRSVELSYLLELSSWRSSSTPECSISRTEKSLPSAAIVLASGKATLDSFIAPCSDRAPKAQLNKVLSDLAPI